MSILNHTPSLNLEAARQILEQEYGIKPAALKPLPSERDQNFLVAVPDGEQLVLKIANELDDREFLEAQNAMMNHLEQRQSDFCSGLVDSVNGSEIVELEFAAKSHFVRLLKFAPGTTLASIKYRSPKLLEDLGRRIGQLRRALSNFDHPSLHRDLHWDLRHARRIVGQKIDLVTDQDLKSNIRKLYERFDRYTAPLVDSLPMSLIHNDANDGNVIVDQDAMRVSCIIDFGDAVYSWTVGELAIAIAYSILGQADPLSAAAQMVAASHAVAPMDATEIDALFGLVCMRLCVSAVIAAEQQGVRPDDPYLTVSQQPIRDMLPRLVEMPYQIASTTFRQSCGIVDEPEAVLSGGNSTNFRFATQWLANNQGNFVFPVVTGTDSPRFTLLDCSVASPLLPNDLGSVSTTKLTTILFREMVDQGADIGVGRYLEPRIVYDSAQFGQAEDLHEERRTIHLGIDLFAPAGATIVAPLDGVVVCSCKIDLPLDYGTLVILRHEPGPGIRFFTLYGHLAHVTLEKMEVGQTVRAGEIVGWLGDETENGGWPPHLHFQIMLDLLDFENDFPGVCVDSQTGAWSAICPDPNLILGLPVELGLGIGKSRTETLSQRQTNIGGSLRVGYDRPIKMVRGWKHWLYDDRGRRFLDAYNNVPHVGHCHPKVVRALTEQANLLNTNTRYLSDSINEFSEKLTATMPGPLNVCFFLNSASEANELALRLARSFTQQKDLIVLEGAYHGHTTTLIDISPYKHNGPGGSGAPEWVHSALLADTYRGPFKDPATAGKKYADEVRNIIQSIQSEGRGLCGFIAESCPSVGGQILFPEAYLRSVYQHVRAAGGVCIADDVQTGYGRLGLAFYGFELQGVVPDIVVLGKPIGNGHPLAAVVTTQPIAEAFDSGMEFFSTFGGNNVSSRVGIEVLKTVQEEGLQTNAEKTGEFLLEKFEGLKSKFDLIGDVRGSGLFLGIELVRDRETLEPAAAEASFIVNRMRDRGVLIGTDGPLHNVIKIRPPMTFGIDEAKLLVAALEQCFAECR